MAFNSSNSTSIFEEGLIGMKLAPCRAIYHSVVFIIGVPLNLIVGIILISHRRLHKARNITWLGVIFSNLTIFLMIPIEYLTVYQQNYVACQIMSITIGTPYLILLINILLATCDRLIYTRWPLFHNIHVTVPRILAVQLTCSIGAFIPLPFLLWPFDKPIRCGFEPIVIKVSLVVMTLVTVLCIGLKLVVYFLVNQSSTEERRGITTREIRSSPRPSPNEVGEINVNETANSNQTNLLAHCDSRAVRRTERNATLTVVIGLIPLCLFTLLSEVYLLIHLMCTALYGDCETFRSFEPCFRELILLHVSTNLWVYICRSLEFRSAAKQFFRV